VARFDVFELSNQRLVVDIQSDHLLGIETHLVIPLLHNRTALHRISRLNPVFQVDQMSYVLMPTLIAAVPVKNLNRKVASLKQERDTIANAIDMVLYGF
jgi:hypothetical protein